MIGITGLIVQNFIHGSVAINVFCCQMVFKLEVSDCDILIPVERTEDIVDQCLGGRTRVIYRDGSGLSRVMYVTI